MKIFIIKNTITIKKNIIIYSPKEFLKITSHFNPLFPQSTGWLIPDYV